ncbi:hypothetical protein [Enterococcus canis]|uniref:hypothetical protein n=1 Tax=Enterococcus canis TaxID=214095 RepID=UPI000B0F6B2F|nr:hypothetical protein [Enterococcus canis]
MVSQEKVIIPLALLLQVLGAGAMLVSLMGVKSDDELNPDYYRGPNEPLFRSKGK